MLVVMGAQLACALGVAALGLLAPAGASALITHNFEFAFNGSDAPGGPIATPGDDAFDQATGDLYVIDLSSEVVDKFTSAGHYASVQIGGAETPAGSFSLAGFSGVAVDNSGGANSGDVYVADTGHNVVDRFSSTGVYQCQITGSGTPSASECNGALGSATPAGSITPTGVAVDGSGDVYVADIGNNVVDVFGPSGAYLRQITSPEITSPTAIALEATGDLYVTNISSNVVKFGPTGAFVSILDSNSPFSVGVDPTTGHVYVTEGSNADLAEFDSSGTLVDRFGSGHVSNNVFGVAVRGATGEVYASDLNNQVEVFGPDVVQPDVATAPVSNPQPASVTLNGTVNPDGVEVSGCRFEYGTTTAYGQSAACVETVGSGTTPVPVHADVTGLTVGVTYHFRLVASNVNGTNRSGDATWGPLVDGESATGATENAVTLQAQIDPAGFDTTYHFEWGPTTSYGNTTPVPDGDIGSGSADQAVSQQVASLTPGTDYHFRVVASNAQRTIDGPDRVVATNPAVAPVASGSVGCANEQFRVGPSAGLPDCRAYEQVTPRDKGATLDMFPNFGTPGIGTFGQGSDDGERVLLDTPASLGPNPGANLANDYVFSRSSLGWLMQSVQPPGAGDAHYGVALGANGVVSPDLSQVGAVVLKGSLADVTVPPGNSPLTLVVGPVGGPYTQVATTTDANIATPDGFQAASSDFSRVFFETGDYTLAPGASGLTAGRALYEWGGGRLSLVDVNTDGSLTSQCGAELGGLTFSGLTRNAVSSDGSRVFFESPDPFQSAPPGEPSEPGCPGGPSNPTLNPPRLYMRVNDSRTVDVSAPNPGVVDPNGFQPVQYVGAAADGSKVFFATKTELTADDTTHDLELYEYDTKSGTLTRVSRGESGSADGNVQWATVSDDGSAVYFTATGQLTADAPVPSAGNADLYRYDTNTGVTRYIATLNIGSDCPLCGLTVGDGIIPVQTASTSNWYVTPDGRFLLFGSGADITGYDSGGVGELYRYDSADGSLACVSCNPSGAAPVGGASFNTLGAPPSLGDARPPRPMSDNGEYVFFDTPDRLVPQAANKARDVYEWHNGALSLVSSGTDPLDSLFVDSSSDGRDVFFGTHAQLAPSDTDFQGDLYDARIGGGFPAPVAPSCSGEGCRGAPSSPSSALLGAPPTTAFSGNGNVVSHSVTPKKKKAGKKHKAKKRGKHSKHRGRHARRIK
jgi:hypothetical protein